VANQKVTFADLVKKTIDLTGNKALAKEIAKLVDERDELLARLRDCENFGELKEFEKIEMALPEKEAELYGEVKRKCAELEGYILKTKTRGKRERDEEIDSLRKLGLEMNTNQRKLDRLFKKYAVDTTDAEFAPEEEKEAFELRKRIIERNYRKEVRFLETSVRQYKVLVRHYKLRRIKHSLIRHSFRIFWSLIIFTVAIGALTSLVPLWYLSFIIIPVVIWIFQETALNHWLDKSIAKIRRQQLSESIMDFFATRIKAQIMITMDANLSEESLSVNDA
jgi:hypothetical protein